MNTFVAVALASRLLLASKAEPDVKETLWRSVDLVRDRELQARRR